MHIFLFHLKKLSLSFLITAFLLPIANRVAGGGPLEGVISIRWLGDIIRYFSPSVCLDGELGYEILAYTELILSFVIVSVLVYVCSCILNVNMHKKKGLTY